MKKLLTIITKHSSKRLSANPENGSFEHRPRLILEIKKNQVSLLFSPEYMNNVIEQGGVISVLWGGNPGHLDNVRKLKVFTRDSKLNKLLFRKGHYNSTIFDLNRGKPAKVLKIFKTIP